MTPKLDQADKDKIREKIKKKEYEKKTESMGKIRKACFDMCSSKAKKPQIPLKDRTLNQIISLKDLDINIEKGSFTVIIGATGAGKTTLLNSMIGELIHVPDATCKEIGDYTRGIKDGEQRALEDELCNIDLTGKSPITINGTTSFCEQQPWIQNGKLRENVLFGKEFEKRRYVETIMACQLEPDLEIMPAGDDTEIGEKGINLSGGQKARVALARAVYARPDVLFMDDPISALDAHVRKSIFDEVFVGLMKDSTRILVTHAVDFIHLADHVIILKDGKVEAQGAYEDIKKHAYMAEIQEIHIKNKRELEKNDIWEALEEVSLLKRAQSSLPTHKLSTDFGENAKRRMSLAPGKLFLRQVTMKEAPVKEIKEVSDSDTESNKTNPMERLDLLEEELDEKLEEFKGVAGTLDG